VKRPKKPSIKDIARAAGVSTAAVSYALSGNGRVSPETQEMVRRIAGEIGFIRDDSAARLRTGRSNLLGAIVHDTSNPFFAELLSDFETLAYEAGYLTIVANTRDDPERQAALIDALLAQDVAGLLISPVHGTVGEAMRPLRSRMKPYVICVRDIADAGADYVGIHDERAGYLAARHLLEAGIRDFAFVGGFDHTGTWRDRLAGIRRAVAEAGMPLPNAMVVPGAPTREAGEAIVRGMLETHPACRATICFNDYVALGAYAALHGGGRIVGQSHSVVGFDNVPQAASLLPALTTVELFPRAIGKHAAKALLRRVTDIDAGAPERLLVEPRLIERDSVVGGRAAPSTAFGGPPPP